MVDLREILPAAGLWTLEDFANYLNTDPGDLQQKLTDNGIKVLHLGQRYKLKIIRIEDIRASRLGVDFK